MQRNSANANLNYSAEIRIWLECGGRDVPLSHACDTFVVAASPTHLPPGDATLVFTVDGTRYERPVVLPQGVLPDVAETPVHDRAPAAARG